MSIDWIKCSHWRFLRLSRLPRILSLPLSQLARGPLGGLENPPKHFISFSCLLSDFSLRHTCMPSRPTIPQSLLIVPFLHFSLFYFLSFSPLFHSLRSVLLDCPTNTKCQLLMVQTRSEQARLSRV